jgi:spermidine synthase
LQPILALVYGIFFLSGAAALMYEVVWVRSLGLIFGGTHLAVTTVLSVFMAGLALGSFLIGKRVDTIKKPLRFYGLLEIAIALFAGLFIILMKIYPAVYIYLVQGRENSNLYLSFIRVLFAFGSLIAPTTLMGGTLPVLTRFISRHPDKLATHLAFLYGFNTLGAVAGTAATGFLLLRFYSVSTAVTIAILLNSLAGLVSILISSRVAAAPDHPETAGESAATGPAEGTFDCRSEAGGLENRFGARLVLVGIAVSGFCALGYEVLWTRILTLTIGTSVYGFSIMLATFLTGIALGSQAYGLFVKLLPSANTNVGKQLRVFGLAQLVIGVSALVVTFYIRDLPVHSIALQQFFLNRSLDVFNARQWANISLAFCYMVVPAFFMGLAFPIAGRITSLYRKQVGHAVGNVLAFNTVGAILGSAVSGYCMIYVFGIEKSLQLLTVVNIGLGLQVLSNIQRFKLPRWAMAGLTVAVLTALMLYPDAFRMWDRKYFAIFQNNQPEAYNTPERKQDALENTEVLFYHEGVDSTISSIKIIGGNQAILVNGKVVASSSLKDRQCQLTLGHLPMLLHKNPRRVLVVGLGTGMTLGATSVHPSVEKLTLVEIEPNVIGAARTFADYNNHVLDDPKLKIVFNDGRNFLMTTTDRYDVITADPIHPWTQGSGYLYTAEYFKIAAAHLLPGGIMCQWLPIYELSVDDLKSVVKTFSGSFKYTMAWLTQYDAELIGSNTPIIIDESQLERRLAEPAVSRDLKPVMMETATDFLSYFIMGSAGLNAFSRGGIVNTDDNLYLEFSTPVSVGKSVMQANVNALARHRESLLPYLVAAKDTGARDRQRARWTLNQQAAEIDDRAHALFLGGYYDGPEFRNLLTELTARYDSFAPGRFLKQEYAEEISKIPQLIQQTALMLLNAQGQVFSLKISGVMARVGPQRAAAIFVDNAARVIYGQRYFSGSNVDQDVSGFITEVMSAIGAAYRREVEVALRQGTKFPAAGPTISKIRQIIGEKVRPSGPA